MIGLLAGTAEQRAAIHVVIWIDAKRFEHGSTTILADYVCQSMR